MQTNLLSGSRSGVSNYNPLSKSTCASILVSDLWEHIHILPMAASAATTYLSNWAQDQDIRPTKPKYLLSGPWQEMFANPWYRWKVFLTSLRLWGVQGRTMGRGGILLIIGHSTPPQHYQAGQVGLQHCSLSRRAWMGRDCYRLVTAFWKHLGASEEWLWALELDGTGEQEWCTEGAK